VKRNAKELWGNRCWSPNGIGVVKKNTNFEKREIFRKKMDAGLIERM